MKLINGKLCFENERDIDLLRDEYPLFDSIKLLIEEICDDIEENGTNEIMMNVLKNVLISYCYICNKYNIYTIGADELYKEFISEFKKNVMS